MNQHYLEIASVPEAREQARKLIENGYLPIPVFYGSKRPAAEGWTELRITADTVEEHFIEGEPSNIGLLTRHMPVLDIDVRDEGLAHEIASEALWRWPKALQRVGEAPKLALLLATDVPFAKLATKDVEIDGLSHKVEVLCDGQQLVAFGRHPSTGEDYEWVGKTPLEVVKTDLPLVTREEVQDFIDWCERRLQEAASSGNSEGDASREARSGDGGPTLWELGRNLREGKANQRRRDWERMAEPIRELERERLIELVLATKKNTLNYDDWISLGIALKTVCGAAAYPAWETFSLMYTKNMTHVIDEKWESFPETSCAGPGTIVHLLRKCGLDEESISFSARELAVRRRALMQEAADSGSTPQGPIKPTPFVLPSEAEIPKRDWIYGRFLIRRFLSLTVAPGGTGKSALTTIEALAMATGRSLLGESVSRKLRVWAWNGEDPQDELYRRLAAACKEYGIVGDDLGDRLMVDTGRKLPIKMAEMDRALGLTVAEPMVAALVEAIRENKIDVLIIDPFATSHLVPENDNLAMNAVVDAWRRVADTAGCAIHLVHHVNKGAALNADQGIYGARGAGAVIDGVRASRFLERMKADEAARLGLESASGFFQVIDGKLNLSPPAQNARWHRMKTVRLCNGDDVGVCVLFDPPDLADEFSEAEVMEVLARLGSMSPQKKSEQAHDWIGYAIAEELDLDVGEPGSKKQGRSPSQNMQRARVKALVAKMIEEGRLEDQTLRDGRAGRNTPVVRLSAGARGCLQSDATTGMVDVAAE